MLQIFFLVFCAFAVVVCEREKRLFSFDFQNQDLSVALDFTIPFISIPIKKDSFGATGLPTINVNPASLVLGGAVLLGTTIMLPLLMKNFASHPGYGRYSRLLENPDFTPEAIISFASGMLTEGRSLQSCALRVACWTVQEHHADPPLILDYIANNKLLSMLVNSTAMEDAMLSGRDGRDCERYSPCPIEKRHVPVLMDNLAIYTRKSGLK